jgi:hypothetical protein
MTDKNPIGTVQQRRAVDRTGTQVGRRLAMLLSGSEQDWTTTLRHSPLVDAMRDVLGAFKKHAVLPSLDRTPRRSEDPVAYADVSREVEKEASVATVLQYLGEKAPGALSQLFRPTLTGFDRAIAAIGLFGEDGPAKSAFLAPIGVLHLFREYFSSCQPSWAPQLGTFGSVPEERWNLSR